MTDLCSAVCRVHLGGLPGSSSLPGPSTGSARVVQTVMLYHLVGTLQSASKVSLWMFQRMCQYTTVPNRGTIGTHMHNANITHVGEGNKLPIRGSYFSKYA